MKLKPFMRIIRLTNMFITFVSVWGGVVIAEGKLFTGNYFQIIIAAFSAALINGAGNIINDIFDVRTDRANGKQRPLVIGELSVREALAYYIALNVTALALLYFFVPIELFFIATATIVILFLYSAIFKNIPLFGNLVVAFLTGLVFIYGGMLGKHWWYDFVPFAFAAEINLIREIVKDLEDLKGDVANYIYTVAFLFEETGTKIFVTIFTILLIFSTPIPYYLFNYKIEYLISVLLTTDLLLVLFIKKLFEKEINYRLVHKLLKLAMLTGLFSILLGVL